MSECSGCSSFLIKEKIRSYITWRNHETHKEKGKHRNGHANHCTADVEVTFKMDTTDGKAIQTACDGSAGDKLKDMFQLCNNTDIMSARNKVFQAPKP